LGKESIECGRDRILRLKRELDLIGQPQSRFKPLGTDSNHLFGDHLNLLRKLDEPSPEQAPGYHRKGLRPDVSGRQPSLQQAAGN